MKKIILTMVFAALLVLSSCSDEKTKSGTNDSQAIQNEMTDAMNGFLSSPGVNAMNNNMAALYNLPFSLPVKSIGKSLDGIEASLNSENVNLLKKVFKVSAESSKQEDHFIFNDWLGTYTYEEYLDEYGNTYGRYVREDNTTNNIIVIIPASYTVDNLEFRLVLNDYQDQYISWTYEGDSYSSDDYFPTLIDMEVFSAGTSVLDLDFTGDWQYMAAMDEVMPVQLQVTMGMDPYSLQITYTNSPSNVLNYDMVLEENDVTMMIIDATITFVNANLEEVSEVDLGYGFGDYYIDFWSDVIEMDTMMESEQYTLEQQVEFLNSEDLIWCYIYENDVKIGRLMAKIVTVTEEDDYGNEYTYDEVVPYILFNDGSIMSEETLAALFGDFEDLSK